MAIYSLDLTGSPNIGVYALTTNDVTIIPVPLSAKKTQRIRDALGGDVVFTSIGATRLAGVLAAANSRGIVLPFYAADEEVDAIKRAWTGNIARITCKRTALGNLLLANDRGALASENLMRERRAIQQIRDALDVEIVAGEIAGLPYVGSLATATNRGVLAHPLLKTDERRVLLDVLKAPVDVGTVNGGVPFVASGLLANEHGVLIGPLTTGPEVMIISNVLDS